MNGQGVPPGQHYAMDTNPRFGPPQADSPLPQRLLRSRFGLPAALFLLPALQEATAELGLLPGSLESTQNYFDNLRGMRYQQRYMQAQSGLAKADIGASEDFFAGIGQLTGMYKTGFRDKDDEESEEDKKHFKSLMKTVEDNSDFLMIADAMYPQLDLLDTLAASEGGSTEKLGRYMAMANQNTIDPTTGKRGLSGESITQRTTAIQEMLYGDLNRDRKDPNRAADNAIVRQRVHGLKLGEMGEAVAAYSRRGLGPSSIGSQLDQEEIAKIREATDTSPEALREVSGDEDVSNTDLAKLSDILQKNNGDVDVSLRKFDAGKTAEWIEKTSGIISAMTDIFGPGKPLEQMIAQLDQLTQNSSASKSHAEVENIARQLKSGMSASGMDWQQTARLTAFAADLREQGGGQREDAFRSTLHTQAFSAAFEPAGLGANEGLSFAGMSRNELMLANTALHAGAATSPVNNQLGMIVRMSEIGDGFEEGSDMYLRAKAIKAGQETYDSDGDGTRDRSVYSRNFSELTDQIKQDSGGNITPDAIGRMLNQTTQNFEAGGSTTEDLTRRMQKGLDVVPAVAAGIWSALSSTEAKLTDPEETAAELVEMVIEFDTLSAEDAVAELETSWTNQKLTDIQRAKRLDNLRDDTTGEINIHDANDAVLKQRMADKLQAADTDLTDARAAAITELIFGEMDKSSRRETNTGIRAQGQLHSDKAIAAITEARERQEIDAEAMKVLSGENRSNILGKISSAIAEVGAKGGDLVDVFGEVVGVDPNAILALAEGVEDDKVRAAIYAQFEDGTEDPEGNLRSGEQVLRDLVKTHNDREQAMKEEQDNKDIKSADPDKPADSERKQSSEASEKDATDKQTRDEGTESERSDGKPDLAADDPDNPKAKERQQSSEASDVDAERRHDKINKTEDNRSDGKKGSDQEQTPPEKPGIDKPADSERQKSLETTEQDVVDEHDTINETEDERSNNTGDLALTNDNRPTPETVRDRSLPSDQTRGGGEGASSGGAEGLQITGTLKVDIETGFGTLAGKGSTGSQKEHTTPV